MLGSGWNCCCCNSTQKAWKTETTPNQWNHWNLEQSKNHLPTRYSETRVPHSIQCLFSISFAFFPVMGRYHPSHPVIQSSVLPWTNAMVTWGSAGSPSRPKSPAPMAPMAPWLPSSQVSSAEAEWFLRRQATCGSVSVLRGQPIFAHEPTMYATKVFFSI